MDTRIADLPPPLAEQRLARAELSAARAGATMPPIARDDGDARPDAKDAPVPESLSYFIPFLLYRVIAKGLKQATGDYAKLDLSLQEARLLIVLHQHKKMRAGTLAEITCIEPSALSHLLRRLVRRNLVMRARAPHDNRAVEVALTHAGRAVAQDCVSLSKTHEAVLLKRFSAAERKIVRALLNRMYANAAVWASDGDAFALTLDRVAPPRRKDRGRRARPTGRLP